MKKFHDRKEIVNSQIDMPRETPACHKDDRIFSENLPLVTRIAEDYHTLYPQMSFEELMEIGKASLIVCAQRFDAGRNIAFPTYAAWWIKHAISQVITRRK